MKKAFYFIGGSITLLGTYLYFPIKQPTPTENPYKIHPKVSDNHNPNTHIITKSPSKIGIIGGGLSGTILAKTLSEQGYNIEILDRNPSYGGIWYNSHDGSKLHIPHFLYSLPDFSFPPDTDLNPKSREVLYFIRSYAENFRITHLYRFNTEVKSIKQNEDDTWSVYTNRGVKTYNFLAICTGRYNKPYIPEIKGIKKFKGKILHSTEFFNASKICQGKKVVVVGSGRSAFDIIKQAYEYGASTTVIMRSPHWLLSSSDLANSSMPFELFNFSRFAGLFLAPFYCDRSFQDYFTSFFAQFYWKFITSSIEENIPEAITPVKKYEKEKLYRVGIYDYENYMSILYSNIRAVRGYVNEIAENKVFVEGKEIQADVIVFATGFEREYFGLPIEKDGVWLYRNTFLPGVKNLAFVGVVNTFCSPLYTNVQAIWLAEVLRGRVKIPGECKMVEDICNRKNYTRSVIGGENMVSFSWFPYPMIDQFIRDMGLSTVRKSNRFRYWFEPIDPKDYALLVTHRI